MDKEFLLDALLRFNYFPVQRRAREELPPPLNSEGYKPEVADKVRSGKTRAQGGYDAVEYYLTRFNGVPRTLSIPHPAAQARVAFAMHDHWDHLRPLTKSPQSQIRPREHDDGRCIIMDYEKPWEKTETFFRKGFGKRFLVHTDVANCFPSIYTHSIAWASVGFQEAKKKKGKKHAAEWFNELDQYLRLAKREETQGIAIGPATSNIAAEVVLGRVDEQLKSIAPHVRYIDDFRAFCDSDQQAQEFVLCLSEELAKYKLTLNVRKTQILEMPQPASPAWLAQLALALPRGDEINARDAVNFIHLAMSLTASAPDGSVLKYALKALASKGISDLGALEVIPIAIGLAFHNPVLIPLLGQLFKSAGFFMLFWQQELVAIAKENARRRRSDGLVWSLYWMRKYGARPDSELRDLIVKSADCLALLFLFEMGGADDKNAVVDYAKSLDGDDLYLLDQHWMLLYHLFTREALDSPYKDEDAFEILRDAHVRFVSPCEEW